MKRFETLPVFCLLLIFVSCGEDRNPPDPVPADSIVLSHVIGDSTTFGSVDDVVFSGGRVFVLDAMNKVVHVFSLEGVSIAQLGGEGEGPGELNRPKSLNMYPDGTLLILDPRKGRIERYLETSEGEFETLPSIPLDFTASDACVLRGRLFLAGESNGQMVHEIDEAGRLVRSFGTPSHDDEILQAIEATGELWCDGSTATLLHVPQTFSTMRAYSLDGTPLWTTEIPDYHQTEYEVSGYSLRPGMDAQGMAHALGGLALLGPDTLLVQLRLTARDAEPVWESRAVSVRNGSELASLGFPGRVVHISDPMVFLAVEDPYPELKVFLRPGQ